MPKPFRKIEKHSLNFPVCRRQSMMIRPTQLSMSKGRTAKRKNKKH